MVVSLNGRVSILMLVWGVHQHKKSTGHYHLGARDWRNFLKGMRVSSHLGTPLKNLTLPLCFCHVTGG